jgi:integrase
MPNKDGHRRFGNVRKLPSGRFQIRYPGPDGRLRTGQDTYERKGDAERALSLIEAQLVTGDWTDPQRGKVKLGVYAEKWIAQRPRLRGRTIELYQWLLARHIKPYLADVPIGKLTPETIREWHATLLANGVSQSATAKAYRLLRAVLMTATDDRIIPRNPCRIRGGGDENPDERPVLTIAQVYQLAGLVNDQRHRALILLATFASLRWGEAIALRRDDIDLDGRTVSIRRQYIELSGQLVVGPPKSRAGTRVVAIPKTIIPELRHHLDTYVGQEGTALIFTGPRGGILRRGNFRRGAGWAKAVAALGVPGLHFHDLRHTGNTLAAPGVSLADLKARMGHDSTRAAIIYQHATAPADQAIADALDKQITKDKPKDDGEDDDGLAGVPPGWANGTLMARTVR